jgi:type IV secretory pathway protease TraF
MNWDELTSLDGRYFGTIRFRTIVGRAEPLRTIKEH